MLHRLIARMPAYLRRMLSHASVFGAYLIAVCVFTWPTVARFTYGIWGRTWDAYNNLWFFHQLSYQVKNGIWSFATNRIFYPVGYDLRADLTHFLLPVLSVPLQKVLPLAAVYNLLLFVSLAFSGWAAWLLAKRFTDSSLAAWIAGLLWLFNPIAIQELSAGSIEVTNSSFFVLSFLALLRLHEKPTLARAVALALLWYLTGLANWLMAAMFGLVLVGSSPFLLLCKKSGFNRRLALMLAGVLAAIFLAAWPLVGPLASGERLSVNDRDTSLASIVTSAEAALELSETGDPMKRLLGDSFDAGDLLAPQDKNNPLSTAIWWLLAALALLSFADTKRRRAWMLGLAGVFLILAMGPYLRWFDQFNLFGLPFSIPMPALPLYRLVPGFTLFYRPYRFLFPFGLLLIGPTAIGITVLLRCSVGNFGYRLRLLVFIVLLGLIGFTAFQQTKAYTDLDLSPEYDQLVRGNPRPVMEVPFFPIPTTLVNAQAMLAQTRHESPIFNATLLRLPDLKKFASLVEKNPLLGTMLDLQLKKPGPYRTTAADAKNISDMGFCWLLARTSFAVENAETDRYRRLPHELFFLLDSLYGAPRVYRMGMMYDVSLVQTTDTYIVVPEDYAVRLRFAKQNFQSAWHGPLIGEVAFPIADNRLSEVLDVSSPPEAAGAKSLCGWFNLDGLNIARDIVRIEMGYGKPGEGPVWSTMLPPLQKSRWIRYCLPLDKFESDDGNAFSPERIGWMRLTSNIEKRLFVYIDDLAFVH